MDGDTQDERLEEEMKGMCPTINKKRVMKNEGKEEGLDIILT